MRIVIVGQQAFGKAVLDAFLARGDQVAGVFAAPFVTGTLAEKVAWHWGFGAAGSLLQRRVGLPDASVL